MTMSDNTRLSEGIFLAAVSALGYSCAFAYEVGFANAYGIPRELISVGLTSVFLAVFGVILSLLIFYNILDMFAGAVVLARHPVVWYFRVPITFAILAVPFAIVLGRHLLEITRAVFLFIALYFVFWAVFPLIMFRKIPGYLNKLKASDDADAAVQSKTITNLVVSRMRVTRSIAAAGGMLLIALSYAYGAGEAANRDVYWVRVGTPDFVVLRVYGERAVLARLDRTTRTILSEYHVVPFADASTLYMRERFPELRLPIEPRSKLATPPRPKPSQARPN